MSFSGEVWNQLKNLTCEDLMRALEKDGWDRDTTSGAVQAYRNPVTRARVTIHYHPGKTYGAKFLKGLLADIGWTERDMRRLKLIR